MKHIPTAAVVVSFAMAAAQAAVPIPVEPASEMVELISRGVVVSPECVLVAEKVSVLDRLPGSGAQAFAGTRERALQLLRNKAVLMNANTARILGELTTVTENVQEIRAVEVGLLADLYRCSRKSDEDAP